MKPGDVVRCACGEEATLYTTGSNWQEGNALLLSWGGYRHLAVSGPPPRCCFCAEGTRPRPAPTRRVAIVDDLARHGCRVDGFEWNLDADVEAAYQRWLAQGSPRCALVAVHSFEQRLIEEHSSGALERFEALASAFHRETGLLAPGKDAPAAAGGFPDEAERMTRWRAWCAERAKKDAPPPKPPPPPKGQLSLL